MLKLDMGSNGQPIKIQEITSPNVYLDLCALMDIAIKDNYRDKFKAVLFNKKGTLSRRSKTAAFMPRMESRRFGRNRFRRFGRNRFRRFGRNRFRRFGRNRLVGIPPRRGKELGNLGLEARGGSIIFLDSSTRAFRCN
jgi:hypothetical protein